MKNKKMTPEHIQKIQDRYGEWLVLQPKLEESFELWQQASAIIAELEAFYFSPEWRELHDNFNEPLETHGNFSVLSEDALWNAFHEQQQRRLKWLKQISEELTKEV